MKSITSRKIYISIGLVVVAIIGSLVYFTDNMEKNENIVNKGQSTDNLNSSSLRLVQTISLPNVSGRIDHMDIDINGQRLFVAELGNNSLDVLDLKEGKRIHSINGLNGPQGVAFIPDANKIVIANGGDGTVQIFDSETYSLVKTISLSSDADNVRYEPSQKLVYVGYGSGGIAIIDPVKEELIDNIKLDGHPESFQISDELQPRIFVNVPESNSIEIIGSQNRTVVTKWMNDRASGNYPMALDEDSHRLFVVYREPSELHVIDTGSGKVIASLVVSGDPDDIFYDAENKQIYISEGQGFIDVLSEQSDNYHEIAKIPTENGARTSLFVPQLDRFYVAIPDYSGDGAKIQVFETHKIQ
ncbi:MAG: YncE family protein [Thaumarchaeota archaeon]|nr:YncE family protein [Nitrososphaerota archaeon]